MTLVACGCPLTDSFYNGPQSITGSYLCTGSSYVLFMSILAALFRNSCKINDPCGRVVPRTTPDKEYDFIVVGGGSGGSVVAGRLAEVAEKKNWKILLVEAGHDEPAWSQIPGFHYNTLSTEIDWQFQTEVEPIACQSNGGICGWPRGKVLGGSGSINGMTYVRATRKDAERWVNSGNTHWNYEELLRLYKKSEDNKNIGTVVDPKYHSEGGPWTVQRYNYNIPQTEDLLRAANDAGFGVVDDLNGDVNYGFSILQTNTRDGMRLSTAKAYLWPQRKNRHLHIMLNSTATNVLIKKSGNGYKKAKGIEFVHNNTTYSVKASKEVILAAGSIQTPQLLLLSGIGDKQELDKVGITQVHNLTGVGKGLQDHACITLQFSSKEKNTAILSWMTVIEYLSNGEGPLSADGSTAIQGRVSSSFTTENDPDGQFSSYSYLPNCAPDGELGTPLNPSNPDANRTFTLVPLLIQPRSKGYIGLNSKDPLAHPKIVANYFTEDIDLKIMVELIRKAQKLIATPVLQKKYGYQLVNQSFYKTCADTYTFDSDDFWVCAIKYGTGSGSHQACSCKMGVASNPEACVNQDLQLHGIENVRITDASVFPTMISGNLQATVVAVAEKGAELIIKKYDSK